MASKRKRSPAGASKKPESVLVLHDRRDGIDVYFAVAHITSWHHSPENGNYPAVSDDDDDPGETRVMVRSSSEVDSVSGDHCAKVAKAVRAWYKGSRRA